jgi:hypothetical protein
MPAPAAGVDALRGGRISPQRPRLFIPRSFGRGPEALSARLKVLILPVDIYRMAKNPELPKAATKSLDKGHQITNM